MSLVEINWYPGGKELRNFGRAGLIIAAIIALLLYVLKDIAVVWLLLIIGVGAAIFAASLLSLKVTRKIYLTLIIVTALLFCAAYTAGIVFSFNRARSSAPQVRCKYKKLLAGAPIG